MDILETSASAALSYAQDHPSAFFVGMSIIFAAVFWLQKNRGQTAAMWP